MPKPQDLLNFAIKLVQTAGNHLEYKVVIEQAYYAAYHAALEFEEKLPHRSTINTAKAGSHEGLIQRLECPHPALDYGLKLTSRDVGAQMRMLKPLRELASYELQETLRINQAEQVIEGAKEVVAECEKARKKIGR